MDSKTVEKLDVIISNNLKKDGLGNVGLDKVKELIEDIGAIVLDVRPPAKVEGLNAEEAGVPNAYYTPYPQFAKYLDILPKEHTTPIVIACLKSWFANRVMGYLEMLGYENVYVLDTNIANLIEVYKK